MSRYRFQVPVALRVPVDVEAGDEAEARRLLGVTDYEAVVRVPGQPRASKIVQFFDDVGAELVEVVEPESRSA